MNKFAIAGYLLGAAYCAVATWWNLTHGMSPWIIIAAVIGFVYLIGHK